MWREERVICEEGLAEGALDRGLELLLRRGGDAAFWIRVPCGQRCVQMEREGRAGRPQLTAYSFLNIFTTLLY